MKRLRYVKIPADEIRPDQVYLMAAIPQVLPPKPGDPPDTRKLNMNMVPCRLEWVDSETDQVTPIVMEDFDPPRIMVPNR